MIYNSKTKKNKKTSKQTNKDIDNPKRRININNIVTYCP